MVLIGWEAWAGSIIRFKMTKAYLYRWTEIATGKWYIGSRYAKNCHPDDGYICSSKVVKPLILSNPSGWSREVLVIGTPTDMRELESKYLTILNAAKDPLSYNIRNGSGSFHTLGRKISEKHMKRMKENNPSFKPEVKEKLRAFGLKRDNSHLYSQEALLKKSEGMKKAWAEGKYKNVGFKSGEENIAKRQDIREKISESLKNIKGSRMAGKTHSEETKLKMAEARRRYWEQAI